MAARILACGQCKGNVSVTGPGQTFVCPMCKTINAVPPVMATAVATSSRAVAKSPAAKGTAKKQGNPIIGLISLVILVAIIWSVCSSSTGGGGAPGPGSVALAGQPSEQALCAALNGDPNTLPPLIDAVNNDAQAGISLQLEGGELEIYLSETNNVPKVQGVIDQMKSTCASQAGG